MLVFDPLTGSSYQIALDDRNGKTRMKPPGTPYRGNNWVHVIDDVDRAYAEPGVSSEVEWFAMKQIVWVNRTRITTTPLL